mgnify:CR=1 FL=1
MFIKKFFLYVSILFLIPLSIYFYKLNFSSISSANDDFYKINILILLLILFIFIISYFLKNIFQTYIFIFFISIFFGLFFFELYVSMGQVDNYIVKKKAKLYENATGNKYDLRTRRQYYQDKLKENNDIVVSVGPLLNTQKKIHSLSGISNSETILCNESGRYTHYISDRYGFNNPDKEWDSENIKYMIAGDSLLQGACVNRPEDLASNLRKFSNSTVINLGFGGNGPLIEYASLREYLKPNVKYVLWFYSEANDANLDLPNELKQPILKEYLTDSDFFQGLKFKQKDINESAKNAILNEVDLGKFNLIPFLKLSSTRGLIYSFFPKKYQPSEIQKNSHLLRLNKINPNKDEKFLLLKFKEIIKKTKDLSEKNNSKLFFVYLPEYNRYNNDYIQSNYIKIKKIIDDLNVPFIDIDALVFQKEVNPLDLFPFRLPGHYNAKAYNKIAQEIERFVSTKK